MVLGILRGSSPDFVHWCICTPPPDLELAGRGLRCHRGLHCWGILVAQATSWLVNSPVSPVDSHGIRWTLRWWLATSMSQVEWVLETCWVNVERETEWKRFLLHGHDDYSKDTKKNMHRIDFWFLNYEFLFAPSHFFLKISVVCSRKIFFFCKNIMSYGWGYLICIFMSQGLSSWLRIAESYLHQGSQCRV